MWLIVLEALAALAVLLFLVWWTMFSGRRRGEPGLDDQDLSEGGASSAEGEGKAGVDAPAAAPAPEGGKKKLKG